MVSSLLSCWTVRVRLASRPGLLLLLGEGNDDEEEDGDADINLLTPTISGQNKEEKGFDPAGAAADSMDLQAVGLLPPRRGATKINLQKVTCRKRHAETNLLPASIAQRKVKEKKGLDPAAVAEKGLDPQPVKKGPIKGLDPVAADEGLDPPDDDKGFDPAITNLGLASVNEQSLVPIEEKLGLCPAPANEDGLLLLQKGISDLDTDDEHAVADPDEENAADSGAEFANEAASADSADFDDDEFDDNDAESAADEDVCAHAAADEDVCAHAADGGDATAPADAVATVPDEAESADDEDDHAYDKDDESAADANEDGSDAPALADAVDVGDMQHVHATTVAHATAPAEDADAGGADPDGDLLMEAKGFVLAAEFFEDDEFAEEADSAGPHEDRTKSADPDGDAESGADVADAEEDKFDEAHAATTDEFDATLAEDVEMLKILHVLHVVIQKRIFDSHVYDDAIITQAKPRVDPKVKKKKSLLLCITINMPFHPGERKMPHAATAGQPKDPVYLFSPLRGSKSEVKDREKKLHVFVEMNPYAARLKMKTKLFMLLFIQAILDPG